MPGPMHMSRPHSGSQDISLSTVLGSSFRQGNHSTTHPTSVVLLLLSNLMQAHRLCLALASLLKVEGFHHTHVHGMSDSNPKITMVPIVPPISRANSLHMVTPPLFDIARGVTEVLGAFNGTFQHHDCADYPVLCAQKVALSVRPSASLLSADTVLLCCHTIAFMRSENAERGFISACARPYDSSSSCRQLSESLPGVEPRPTVRMRSHFQLCRPTCFNITCNSAVLCLAHLARDLS